MNLVLKNGMSRPRVRSVLGLLLFFVAAGCAQAPQRMVETLNRTGTAANVVLMPLDVVVFELPAAGLPEPQPDWTKAAHRNLDAAIRSHLSERQIALTAFDPSRLSEEERLQLAGVQRHIAVVQRTIEIHHDTRWALPSKAGRLDWTIGPVAQGLLRITGADYALLIQLRDSHSSAGRVALMTVGTVLAVPFGVLTGLPIAGPRGGEQVGRATLVDLQTGKVVWFHRLRRESGDLRSPESAMETARALLSELPQ